MIKGVRFNAEGMPMAPRKAGRVQDCSTQRGCFIRLKKVPGGVSMEGSIQTSRFFSRQHKHNLVPFLPSSFSHLVPWRFLYNQIIKYRFSLVHFQSQIQHVCHNQSHNRQLWRASSKTHSPLLDIRMRDGIEPLPTTANHFLFCPRPSSFLSGRFDMYGR